MLSRWLVLCALASAVAGPAGGTRDVEQKPRAPHDGVFSYLECNRGQSDPSVDFLARCGQYTAWIRPADVVVALPAAAPFVPPHERRPGAEREPPRIVDVRLVGAAPRPVVAEETLPGVSNYFIGRDESRWVSGAPHVRRARYAQTWPGVGVLWSMEARRLHVEFDVAPGAETTPVAFAIDGASSVCVAADGSLRIAVPGGEAALSPPSASQPGGRSVDVRWEIRADGTAGFALGAYDRRLPLTIDPTLTYSTYLGGSADETPGGIAADSSGNAYVAGNTYSSNMPITSGVYQSALNGGQDAYCAKFNSSGSTLSYCTFLGGSSGEIATGLAVDSSGNAFVAGYTGSTDFPTTSGAAATSKSGTNYSGFVVKLNSTGSARSYATYVNNGYLWCLAVDSAGAAYVGTKDAQIKVYKLNAAGTSFSYTTTYGVANASQEFATGVAVDTSGNAYYCGYTDQSSFPTTTGAYKTTYGGGFGDGFVFKLNSSGNVLWSTFLGASGDDYAYGVAVDGSGYPWVVGYTKSSGFPTTSNAYDSSISLGEDGFLTKLDTGGASLGYSTFLGGTDSDYAFAVAVRGAYVYVGGQTASTDFPTLSAYQSTHGGGASWDAFLSVFQCDGVLVNSTYLGGSNYDYINPQCVAADTNGDAYLQVQTASTDFPTYNAYDTTLGGTFTYDAGVVKMTGLVTPFAVNAATLPQWTQGISYGQTFSTAGAIGAVTWTVSAGALPAGMTFASTSTTSSISGTPTAAGTFNFTLRATDACQQVATRQFTWIVNPPPFINAVTAPPWTRTVPFSLQLVAGGGTTPLTFSVDSGTVPPGLTFDAGGGLTGTPTTAGSYSFDAKVTDLRGATAKRTVTTQFAEVPSIAAKTFADCTEDVPYSTSFTASDGTPPLTFSFVTGTYPFVKPVDPDLGTVASKTRGAGSYAFTLRITDSVGAHSDRDFSMLLNPAPQIDTFSLPLSVAGRGYRVTLHGHGGTPPVKWQLHTVLPTGLQIDQDAGVVSGIPSVPVGAAVQFGYEDPCGGAALRALRLDVANPFDLTKKTTKAVALFDETAGRTASFFALEVLEGTDVAITLTPKLKGDFPVDVALFDPSSAPVDLAPFGGLRGRTFKVKGFRAPATGRYILRLSPIVPFSGSITVSVAAAAASSFGGTFHLDGASPPADLRVPALAGATLTLTVKGVKHSTVAPDVTSVQQGGTELLVPGEVKGKGTVRTLKLGATLAVGDVHVLVGAAAGTSGDATWSIKLKQPKTYTFSMTDVPLGE